MKRYLHPDQKILIAGARGMVGSAIGRQLKKQGYHNLLTPSRQELDYCEQAQVRAYFKLHQPDVVVIAAAKVGGIYANMTYPAEFIYQNIMIESHLIHEAHMHHIDRLLFLGSSCIYPKFAPQPMTEEVMLTSSLEPTNEAYAIAKIAGIKLCDAYRQQYGRHYISAMPTNLYGPGDSYHPENSHVIPGLMRRFYEAKIENRSEVVMWGSGNALREFLFVDDLAEACVYLLESYDDPMHINIGSHEEISIGELAKLIAKVVGYEGKITHDLTKPDGVLRKKTDISRITALGWQPKISLEEGLPIAFQNFLVHYNKARTPLTEPVIS